MTVEWTPVKSSNIAAIGYESNDKDLKTELHVQFNSGSEYVYHSVPADIVQEFLDADSKGKYLNERIKGTYQFDKV